MTSTATVLSLVVQTTLPCNDLIALITGSPTEGGGAEADEVLGLKRCAAGAGAAAPWRKGVERESDLNWRIGGEVRSIV